MEYLVFTSNWPKQEHSEITGEAKRVFCDSHLKREEAPQCEPRFPPSARHCLLGYDKAVAWEGLSPPT